MIDEIITLDGFDPMIDDLTIYHNGDYTVSTAELIDNNTAAAKKAAEDAAKAMTAAGGAIPSTAEYVNDINEARKTGFYYGYATINAPEEGFMYFEVIAYPDGYNFWVKQLAYSFADNKTYIRTMAEGVWSEWSRMPHKDNIGELSTLLTADKSSVAAAINELVQGKANNDHKHAGLYAPMQHDHNTVYAPAIHTHDGTYAPANHTHSQYLTSVPQYSSNTGETIYVCGPNRGHKTVQSVADSLPKFGIGRRTIQIDAGDYPEKVVFKGLHGGPVYITTSAAYAGRANLLGIVLEDCTATIVVQGVNIQQVNGQNPTHGVYPTRCGIVKVEDCVITSVAYGVYAVATDKIVVRNTTVNAISGNLTAAVGMAESEGTFVVLDGLTVNGGYGTTAIHAQNAVIVGKRPTMNSVDVELNQNAGGVYYNVVY